MDRPACYLGTHAAVGFISLFQTMPPRSEACLTALADAALLAPLTQGSRSLFDCLVDHAWSEPLEAALAEPGPEAWAIWLSRCALDPDRTSSALSASRDYRRSFLACIPCVLPLGPAWRHWEILFAAERAKIDPEFAFDPVAGALGLADSPGESIGYLHAHAILYASQFGSRSLPAAVAPLLERMRAAAERRLERDAADDLALELTLACRLTGSAGAILDRFCGEGGGLEDVLRGLISSSTTPEKFLALYHRMLLSGALLSGSSQICVGNNVTE